MLLYGAEKDVCAWASRQYFGHSNAFIDDKAIGLVKDNKLIAAAIYSDFKVNKNDRIFQVELSGFALDKCWGKRYIIEAIFAYPFTQLDFLLTESQRLLKLPVKPVLVTATDSQPSGPKAAARSVSAR